MIKAEKNRSVNEQPTNNPPCPGTIKKIDLRTIHESFISMANGLTIMKK